MLDLVTIFLITFLTAFIAVRFYRAVEGWCGFRQPLAGKQNKSSNMSLKTQMGFISLFFEPKQKAKTVRLRGPKTLIKAPWGW